MKERTPWQHNDPIRKRRAALILREYGVPKVAIAYALGVSRKTVDAWLKQVNPKEAYREYDDFRIRQY